MTPQQAFENLAQTVYALHLPRAAWPPVDAALQAMSDAINPPPSEE